MTRPRNDRRQWPASLPCLVVLLLVLGGCAPQPVVPTSPGEPTLADLPAGTLPAAASGRAGVDRERVIMAYRDYLARYPASPERRDILRRLADLLVETAGEAMTVLPAGEGRAADMARQRYAEAVTIYEQLLREDPAHPDRGEIYYQLSRACEETGQAERAMTLLDELIRQYPATDTRLYADALFRRGELQFDAGRYAAAEASYRGVVALGEAAPVYEQSLYKLGWARFRQEQYEPALDAFFALLDRRLPPGTTPETQLARLAPAEREQLADVFRAISLCFSYLEGAVSIDARFRHSGPRHYAPRIYRNLAEFYDRKALYTDAATTRLALAERLGDSAAAPRLYIEVIGIYRQAGFRERLLETHAAFVGRYGLDGGFWDTHERAALADVVAQLQSSLVELARHYHARALEAGEADDYRQAGRWYRQYLLAFPDAARAVEMNLLLAELLYAGGDYPQAVAQYARVAYRSGEHPRRAEAGLNALLACERQLPQAAAAAQAGWQARCTGLATRFVEAFPEQADAVAVLTRTGAGLIERQQAGEAVRVCHAILERGDAVPPALRQAAWVLLAQAQFSLGEYRAAELAYREALTSGTLEADRRAVLSEAMAAAIYRQAEQQRAQGNRAEAASGFLRAAATAPGSSVQPVAQYDAAASLLAAERWDEAARTLERFRADHPDHQLQGEATHKLAFAYAQSGRSLDAAGEYVRLAGIQGDAATGREALLHAADLYRQAGRDGEAVEVLERCLARYPRPAEAAAEVMQRLAGIEAARGDSARHRYWLRALVKAGAAAGAGDARTRALAARARLALADYRIADFDRLRIEEPLQQHLADKLQAMQQAISELEAAAGYGIAPVTTAATYRIGRLYHDLGRALLDSARPRGLGQDELARYNLLLEQEAAPFEEKAIEFHQANIRRIPAGHYDDWVARSLAQLGELWPARYARQEHTEALVDSAPVMADAGSDYARAMALMRAQHDAEAAGLLVSLDEAAPPLRGVPLNLAIAYLRLGEDSNAEAALRRALAQTPDSPVAHNLQGILHRRAGRFQQARGAYAQALRLRPDYPMAHINLGILCDMYLQDADCALRHYRDYLRLSTAGDGRVALWIADLEQRQEKR